MCVRLLCVYWQAIQREFSKVPAPSFLVYYRFRLTSKPQPPLCSGEGTLQKDAAFSSQPRAEREFVASGDTPAGPAEQQQQPQQKPQQKQQEQEPGEEKFLALVRFAVIASKGHQEWIAADNEEWGPFFRGELGRLEEWLQRQQINHPDFNTFRLGASKR
ncbi:hypothetical protein, conserved [Eimeria maxima]|uniref:Uncharacterized protein n=1 Tax=Eimeria maxima TaxID=5804 RepID=U6M7X2_EIMMA|nr:hypothetical protein, conserved [Eimeria maxima]CDJ60121.1 hypothetical protein, conserved [Eimeria maxima]